MFCGTTFFPVKVADKNDSMSFFSFKNKHSSLTWICFMFCKHNRTLIILILLLYYTINSHEPLLLCSVGAVRCMWCWNTPMAGVAAGRKVSLGRGANKVIPGALVWLYCAGVKVRHLGSRLSSDETPFVCATTFCERQFAWRRRSRRGRLLLY